MYLLVIFAAIFLQVIAALQTAARVGGKENVIMCLALPGKVLKISVRDELPMGEVDFSGVRKSVCLAYTPNVKVGEYVIVHVGFSISILQEDEALRTLELLS